jgi:hypothetical protein
MPRSHGDEGGMSIRLDPRRLAALKLLAAEIGVRPGELVTKWVEERLDAARSGEQPAVPAGARPAELAALSARIDELTRRVDGLTSKSPAPAAAAVAAPSSEPAAPAKRRGRPPKSGTKPAAAKTPRVPLHDEIAAVIAERGPMTAGELAAAIVERGRYTTPRSAKPIDSTTVNARVSNPIYRSRFTRDSGRIGLANAG